MHLPKFLAASCLALLAATGAAAQEFAVLVSPPRFELEAKPGERLRDVVEITNMGSQAAQLNVRSADWSLAADGGVNFHDDIQPGSCRPWVAIERHELNLPARGRYRYRFEVTPPPGTTATECRFALLIEGGETQVKATGGVSFPVGGRIGVIVYVGIAGAAPQLTVERTSTTAVNGQRLPTLHLRNTGNAHGRVAGFLSGQDASGRTLEFTPSTLPIMPGETRAIPLTASVARDQTAVVAYPVTIRGTLESGSQKLAFEQRFE